MKPFKTYYFFNSFPCIGFLPEQGLPRHEGQTLLQQADHVCTHIVRKPAEKNRFSAKKFDRI